jgi:hypothetical protein
MKKLVLGLALAAVFAAACGGDGKKADSADGSTTATADASATAAPADSAPRARRLRLRGPLKRTAQRPPARDVERAASAALFFCSRAPATAGPFGFHSPERA